jgi:uncharacterized protein (DUF58 family)
MSPRLLRRRQGPPLDVQAVPRRTRSASPSQVPTDRLRLTVLRRIDGLLAGDHAGLLPGHGSERGEARPYVPGDDPRHIDWAVTARTHVPHVRDTIADHELDVWLVVDSSASIGFGTGRWTKHDLAWASAGAFALLASDGGNRIGAVRTTPRVSGTATTAQQSSRPHMMPARSGSNHVGAVLAALRRPPIDGEVGDLPAALEMVNRTAKRRGMVVVVSDFLGSATWERPLRALGHRHEVVAIELVDPREIDLPDVGLISVVDPETGRRRLVDTARPRVRERYRRAAAERRAAVAAQLATAGTDHLTLRTDRDWVLDFVDFVASRRSRMLAMGDRHR